MAMAGFISIYCIFIKLVICGVFFLSWKKENILTWISNGVFFSKYWKTSQALPDNDIAEINHFSQWTIQNAPANARRTWRVILKLKIPDDAAGTEPRIMLRIYYVIMRVLIMWEREEDGIVIWDWFYLTLFVNFIKKRKITLSWYHERRNHMIYTVLQIKINLFKCTYRKIDSDTGWSLDFNKGKNHLFTTEWVLNLLR